MDNFHTNECWKNDLLSIISSYRFNFEYLYNFLGYCQKIANLCKKREHVLCVCSICSLSFVLQDYQTALLDEKSSVYLTKCRVIFVYEMQNKFAMLFIVQYYVAKCCHCPILVKFHHWLVVLHPVHTSRLHYRHKAIKIVSSPSTQVKEEGGLSFDSIGCVGHSFFITTVLVQNRTVDSHHKNSFRHKPDKLVCTISDLSKDTFETCSTFYSFHSEFDTVVSKLACHRIIFVERRGVLWRSLMCVFVWFHICALPFRST